MHSRSVVESELCFQENQKGALFNPDEVKHVSLPVSLQCNPEVFAGDLQRC